MPTVIPAPFQKKKMVSYFNHRKFLQEHQWHVTRKINCLALLAHRFIPVFSTRCHVAHCVVFIAFCLRSVSDGLCCLCLCVFVYVLCLMACTACVFELPSFDLQLTDYQLGTKNLLVKGNYSTDRQYAQLCCLQAQTKIICPEWIYMLMYVVDVMSLDVLLFMEMCFYNRHIEFKLL